MRKARRNTPGCAVNPRVAHHMKIKLSQIPEEGHRQTLVLPLKNMARLTEVVGEQGGEVTAELLVKDRDGAVEITGRVLAALQPPCQRCLDPVPLAVDEPVRVAMVSLAAYEEGPEDVNLGVADLELSYYQGEEVDLAHVIEDELLLLIPEPVAEEDEEGRCLVCGKMVDEVLATEAPDPTDHPFAEMKRLLFRD